jgi:hypothetical protein
MLHKHSKVFILGCLALCVVACGSILGLGSPTVEQEGGAPDAAVPVEGGRGAEAQADVLIDQTTPPDQEDGGAFDGSEDGGVVVYMGDAQTVLAPCTSPQQRCAGTCTDTSMDSNNCGTCGNVCTSGTTCIGSVCALQCDVGATVCVPDGDSGAPYCSDLSSDPRNCGGCGAACAVNNNSPSCGGGACGIGTCQTGYANCGDAGAGDAGLGCFTHTDQDPLNCGTCGNVCPEGQYCSSGTCSLSCPPSLPTTCSNTSGGEYCANLTNDPLNCESCGSACPVANNTPACSSGACTIGTCATGYANCNGSVSDGCETQTTTNPANCGGCGTSCATVCSSSNVSQLGCSGGACGVVSCASGYYDIDQSCTDGCECQASALGTCSAPTMLTNATTYTGVLVPAGAQAWFQVTFVGNTNVSTFHPLVSLSTNPNAEYVFDIDADCTGNTISCAASTIWETSYSGVSPEADPTNAAFTPIVVGNAGTVLIHVYRAPGAPVDCSPYTLTVSD